jgi:autophagy-related protein 5
MIDSAVSTSNAWFSFENVPLKWHYPIGLLYDLFSGSIPSTTSGQHGQTNDHSHPGRTVSDILPWRLTLHFSEFPDSQLVRLDEEGKVLHDAWINSIKEADFLRNGTAKAIMSLSKEDSTVLWKSASSSDFSGWASVHSRLVPASTSLRHIPIRFYLPSASSTTAGASTDPPEPEPGAAVTGAAGHIRVAQVLVQPFIAQTRVQQTMGSALHGALPTLFPSRRTPIIARPVLHGAVAPMAMTLEDAMRTLAFTDGWLHVGIDMMA